ncbi:MAG: hypothetical protein J7K96_01785, partial [Desulfobacteraceae bacterium]|nr:hypothetical protein [Desulfobacteraceae bacterium]
MMAGNSVKKIIDLFHQSISKDNDRYFISRIRDGILEKMYFYFKDAAIFVFAIILKDDIILKLNTRNHLTLNPANLYVMDDNLYVTHLAYHEKTKDEAQHRIWTF